MMDTMVIWMTGVDGSRWDLSGPDAGIQGVELRPGPKRFIDAPVKTFWLQGAINQVYQGLQYQRRDPLFSVTVFADNPLAWRDIDSRFRLALGDPNSQFTLHVEVGASMRSLDLRLLQEPTAYEQGAWEGKDPALYAVSTLQIQAAAEQPFWYGPDLVTSWSLPSGTSGSTTLSMQNFGDVIVWPSWFVNAPASWMLPDFSWGQEAEYQRPAGADATRTVALPALLTGEDSDVQSDPDQEWIIAANGAPVWQRGAGAGMLYPIAPRTPATQVPVSVTGANAGASVTLTIPQRFSRPFGVSL